MDDIDDYFDDDLVLDEHTLAILDREEQKYVSQIQQQKQPLPAVTKKLKTRDGWSPGVGSQTREDEFDDLPEISVTADGNYGFTDSAALPTNSSQTLQTQQHNASQAKPPSQNGLASLNFQPHISLSRSNLQPTYVRPVPIPNLPPPRLQNTRQTPAIPNRQNGVTEQSFLQNQLADLQAQLSALKNENQKIQDALKVATDLRYAKEGEVTILRKTMEKTATNHAAEIARIKAAKEEAEIKQKQRERELRDETERLKTQFIFKQQELEASFRKPPPSARAARVMKTIPTTPVRIPSQMDSWTTTQDLHARQRPNHTPHKTGRNPQIPHFDQKSPVILKKPAFLPGFQNSFATTPLRLGANDLKGKGRDVRRDDSFEHTNQVASQRLEPWVATQPFHHHSSPDREDSFKAGASSDGRAPSVDEDGDSLMVDDVDESSPNEVEPIEPLNYKAELFRIIMTHTQAHATEAAFQVLISLPFSQQFPSIQQAKDCTQACQTILVTLSDPVDDSDYDVCIRQVTKSLLSILRILLGITPCSPVTALLSLLSSLVLSLPSFTRVLLAHEDEEGPSLFVMACDLITHLVTSPISISKNPLRECLLLLETLLYDLPDEIITHITLIPKLVDSLVPLLSTSQSHELIESLGRVFTLLTTYSAFQTHLSSPIHDSGQQENQNFEDSHFIRHLCVYLLENLNSDHSGNTAIHSTFVGCLAQLSLTQAENLARSHLVIPTLVYFVAHLSITLWNEDKIQLKAPLARPFVRSINQGLFLLHHLVYSSQPIAPLREKLQHSPHRNLTNLVNMFVVSFGQLSYSEPPDWIEEDGRAELESLAECARKLLDLVVDGPEGGDIWVAYQMEPDNESELDEEEKEARRLEDTIQS